MEPSLPEYFELWQRTLGWQPTPQQQANFQRLYRQILEANRHLNLTRLTTPEDFWEKHLWDSLRGIAPWLNPSLAQFSLPSEPSLRGIDVGSGGGFPGLPVAIVKTPSPKRPDAHGWQLYLVDATRKKVAFLTDVADKLALPIKASAERAEVLGQHSHHRARYDLALIRAVGSAPTCTEYTLPFLKRGGVAVLYRGQWTAEESKVLEQIAPKLGGQVVQVDACQTPLTQGIRHYIYLQKHQETPDIFPRGVGVPAKSPLS